MTEGRSWMLHSLPSSPQSWSEPRGWWDSSSPGTVLLALRQARESHRFLITSLRCLKPQASGQLRADIDHWLDQLDDVSHVVTRLVQLENRALAAIASRLPRAGDDQVPEELQEGPEPEPIEEPPADQQLG